jgi:hypothetical protein
MLEEEGERLEVESLESLARAVMAASAVKNYTYSHAF